MAPNKIIIDTDPGIDDILALLLALSASKDELEIALISLTFGNIEVRSCLRNLVSMFYIIEKELAWRRERGQAEGFEALKVLKPTVAVGADHPLGSEVLLGDYFHGLDGLGGVHASHPHLTPQETWESLFFTSADGSIAGSDAEPLASAHTSFIPSKKPSHQEILRVLKENEPGTVSIVAVGPLTNLALAAAEDPETFLRAKEVVIMGGAIGTHGNVTPVAEFNIAADPIAAARVFALTSPRPASTMPPTTVDNALPPYPAKLGKQLTIKLFPLNTTHLHNLTKGDFTTRVTPIHAVGSPLAEWVTAILSHSWATLERLHPGHAGDKASLSLHDPLCVWYAMARESPAWITSPDSPIDIRVETTGQWTRGMCVVDRRKRHRRDEDGARNDDHGHWLSNLSGNRVDYVVGSPGQDTFGGILLDRIFGI